MKTSIQKQSTIAIGFVLAIWQTVFAQQKAGNWAALKITSTAPTSTNMAFNAAANQDEYADFEFISHLSIYFTVV